MKKFLMMVVAASSALCVGGGYNPYFADGMQANFRADDPALNNGTIYGTARIKSWCGGGASKVTVGALDTASENMPYFIVKGFRRADGTYKPAVRFHHDYSRLATADGEKTTLNITTDSTWFLVCTNSADQAQRGIFGLREEGNPRLGAFFLGSPTNTLRTHNSCNYTAQFELPRGTWLIDSRRKSKTAATRVLGEMKGATTGLSSSLSDRSTFSIGGMSSVNASARMDLGELLIYNRALNDAEMRIVQNALAVKYGLALADEVRLYTDAGDGFNADLVGIGYAADTATDAVPGTAAASGSSGGLRLTALNDSVATAGEYLLAVHKDGANAWQTDVATGLARMSRVWRVMRVGSDGMSARFTFSLTEAGFPAMTGVRGRLLWRSHAAADFAVIATDGVWNADEQSIAFDLEDGQIVSGEYTFALTAGRETHTSGSNGNGLTVWLRASDGVTLSPSNTVETWSNLGALGSAVDVHAVTGGCVTVAEGNAGEPTLRFDGTAMLKSTNNTAYGITGEGAWFVVYQPRTPMSDYCLFGSDIGDPRFGAFFPKDSGGQETRGFLFGHPQKTTYFSVANSAGVFQMSEARVHEFADQLYSGGARNGSVTETTEVALRPTAAKLAVGHFNADGWNSKLIGDISEIRIYNRAPSDAERIIIENHLAARHGVTLVEDAAVYDGGAAYGRDVVGIGCTTEQSTTNSPGAFSVSGMSGGLRLQALNGTCDEQGEFVFAGHSGAASGWVETGVAGAAYTAWCGRDWRVTVKKNGGTMDVRVSFDLTALGLSAPAGEEFLLLKRTAATEDFTVLPVAANQQDGVVSFDFPRDGLVSGYYTLGRGAVGAPEFQRVCAGVGASLRGWFRATDVEADNGGAVTAWRNIGEGRGDVETLGKKAGSPTCAENAFERAEGVFEPSIRFDGTCYFESATATVFDVTGDISWFLVARTTATETSDRSNMRVFGFTENDYRCGAFFTGTASANYPFRAMGFGNVITTKERDYIEDADVPLTDPVVMDFRRAGRHLSLHRNGDVAGSQEGTETLFRKSKFRIGRLFANDAQNLSFKGDIAEVRVYNRALNDAERIIVQNHLAARYGIPMAESASIVYTGATAAAGDYDLDVVGIGCSTSGDAEGRPGVVSVSDDSAGLRFSALTTLADGDFLLAGHKSVQNAWTRSGNFIRWTREWFVEKTAGAGLSLRVVFSFDAAGVKPRTEEETPQYKLLFRSGDTAFADMELEPIVTDGGVAFIIPAERLSGLSSGQLTLGAAIRPTGTLLVFR